MERVPVAQEPEHIRSQAPKWETEQPSHESKSIPPRTVPQENQTKSTFGYQEYVLPMASPTLLPSIKHFSSLKNSSMNLANSEDLSALAGTSGVGLGEFPFSLAMT